MGKAETKEFDTVVIGAGLIGSAVAMHLAELGAKRVALLDLDFAGVWSSSELNAGGVRATWNQEINVALSKASMRFMSERAKEVGYHASGYLWLYTEEQWPLAERRTARLNQHGLNVSLWSPARLREHAPFLDKLDGVAGASFSPHDGLFNPNLLKLLFRERAQAAGVTFLDRHRIVSATREVGRIKLECRVEAGLNEQGLRDCLTAASADRSTVDVVVAAEQVANCAGAWGGNLAAMLGYSSATKPVRRQACVFSCRDLDLRKYGMIVDTSGVYFHPEADNILAGWADPEEPEGFRLDYDGQNFFEEKIWLPLFERSSCFESLKHITGWGGLYEVTPDHSGIIGPVASVPGLFEAHGFSGHGAMQSYAVGLALAERMHLGAYRSIDCSSLAGDRFARGALVDEGLVI